MDIVSLKQHAMGNMEDQFVRYNPMPAMVFKPINGHITFVNLKAEELTGWEFNQLVGTNVSDLFSLATYEPGEYESLLHRKGEQLIEVIISIQAVVEENSSLSIISFWGKEQINKESSLTSNIVATKIGENTEQRLLDKLQELELINKTIPNISWKADVDESGNFKGTHISGSVDDFLDLPRGTINNDFDLYFSYIVPEYLPMVLERITYGILNPGNVVTLDYQVKKANGEIIWVSSKGRAVVTENATRIFGFTHDITERKNSEQELRESEEKFELFFSQSVTGFFFMMIDEPVRWNNKINKEETLDYVFSHTKVTKINDALAKQYGVTTEQMIGLCPNDIFAGKEKEYRSIWAKFFDEGKWHIQTQERRSDGKLIDIEGDCTCLYNEQGMVTGLFGVQMDVSEQKRIMKALDESEAKYRTLVEASRDSIFIIQNGRIKYANKELLRLSEYIESELIDRSFINFVAPNEQLKVISYFEQRINGEEVPVRYESVAQTKSGKLIDVEVSVINIEFLGQNAEMVILRDISKKKKTELVQQFLYEISELASLNISLRDFLSRVHRQLKSIMKADNFYIALYDKVQDKYTFPYYFDEFDDYEGTELLSLEGTLTDHIRKTGKGQIITEEIEKDLFGEDNFNLIGEYSQVWLGAPLVDSSTNEVIGVIAIQDYKTKEAYTSDDLITLEIIANNIGLLIDRFKYLESLKKAKELAQEGEQRYKSLFNDNASAMLLIDPDIGTIVDANKAACSFYGYSHRMLTKLRIQQINIQKESEVKEDLLHVKNNRRSHFFYKQRLKNGNVRDVEIYAGRIRIGVKPFIYTIVHDITEQKAAEQEIIRLSKAIDQTSTPIALTDLDGYFTYVNPRFCELSEYSREELIGQSTRILRSGMQNMEFYEDLWSSITSGNIWKGEIVNRKKGGDLYLEEVNIAPVFNDKGEKTHYVKVSRDITAQRQMQNELITAKEKAEESDRLKSAFLANISHEIRTPMNGILGFSSLLYNEIENVKHLEFLKIIMNSADRLLDTVNDVIDIAKIEAGQLKLSLCDFNINELLSDLFKFYQKRNLEFDLMLTISDEKPIIIRADKTKVYQILNNLVGNAVKFTKEGYVKFGYQIEGKNIIFVVEDTGIGIEPEYVDKVFDRFFQVNFKYTREYEGTGLGLAIVKQLVELMNGEIWLESAMEKGTKFFVKFSNAIITE